MLICHPMSSPVSKLLQQTFCMFDGFLRSVQPVLVSRKDPDSCRNTILEIERRAQSGWPAQILIFPEGTCTNRLCLITFIQGAFVPGVPVQPVLIRYPNKLDTVSWTGQGPKSARLLLLTLCQLYTTVEIEFLPPWTPTEIEKKSPTKFAHSVRAVMAESLGLPVTDHTYEDCRLMIAARQLTLPTEAGLVKFTKISRKLELKWDNVKKELQSFANIACSCKGGRITSEEFAIFFKLPISPALLELFTLFDRDSVSITKPWKMWMAPLISESMSLVLLFCVKQLIMRMLFRLLVSCLTLMKITVSHKRSLAVCYVLHLERVILTSTGSLQRLMQMDQDI
ncbi:lysophosphatidylcholine acyltransferase 2-like [Myxocyprinus asiaticus]|uniref:lysophosphatidylcholine acyltransferase 2-like n=1 Tax=Myxocyprinus asiaticus TaxID=70543 RepID=UPI0022222612|nr:lysophosphatidylcholine acyltransferase 2-like [Myxocyprinus asiaticus]